MPQKLSFSSMEKEGKLEQIITEDISILNENWFLIGRQVQTDFNTRIDLLAIDGDGVLIIIELKKDKTPRDVIAQTLDYASWIETLSDERIENICAEFTGHKETFSEGFKQKFGADITEKGIQINNAHQMVIVATELDESTERIVNYLNKHLIDKTMINVMFFSIFEDNHTQYLSRAWLIEPDLQDFPAINQNWNGEVYCNFGASEEGRSWEDARKYQFVAAGGGLWYSRTLKNLKVGERIWVKVPGWGYTGVGIVTSEPMTMRQFLLKEGIKEDALQGDYWLEENDQADYAVKIDWLHTVPLEEAIKEGFGNQNSVAKPTTPKWQETTDKLKKAWGQHLKI